MSDFKQAVEYVLFNEGGYSDHPMDPGGRTKFGISQARFPHLDIPNLSLEDAIQIYERYYWSRWNISMLKDQEVATKMLDATVVMGPKAAYALQRALRALGVRVREDGVLGPETASAANLMDKRQLMPALRSELAAIFRSIVVKNPARKVFEKGWLNRAYQ